MAPTIAPNEPQLALKRRLANLRNSRGLTQVALAEALSQERTVGSPTVSNWESMTKAAIPSEARLKAYARLFASERSFSAGAAHPRLLDEEEIATDVADQQRYEELRDDLLSLLAQTHAAEEAPATSATPQRSLLHFTDGNITIVCPEPPEEDRGPLADPANPNYTLMHRLGDADSLVEVYGHVRALNPTRGVHYRGELGHRIQDHLILIGGIGWSPLAKRVYQALTGFPIEQFEHPDLKTGEIFKVTLKDKTELRFPSGKDLREETRNSDIALIARLRNPYNSSRTLTILSGIHSRGVYGAALAVTGETTRAGNEAWLAERFPSGDFAVLVRVEWPGGRVLAPDFQNEKARLFEWSPGENEEK